MSAAKKVLIIDDYDDYRRLLGEILRLHDWQVLEADEGEAGLDLVRQQRPEIVLCDLLMPRGNGFLVCRKIRADITLRHTKRALTNTLPSRSSLTISSRYLRV
jgi:CheY-like chemotaxis protein